MVCWRETIALLPELWCCQRGSLRRGAHADGTGVWGGHPWGPPWVSPMLCPAALRFYPTRQEEVEGRPSGEGVGRWGMKQSKPASMEIKLIRTPGRGEEGGGGKQLQSKDRINICAEAFSFQVLLRWGCSVGGAELRMRVAAVGWAWGGLCPLRRAGEAPGSSCWGWAWPHPLSEEGFVPRHVWVPSSLRLLYL